MEDMENLEPFLRWMPAHLTMPHASVVTDDDIDRMINSCDRDLYGDRDRFRADPIRKKALRKAKKKMRVAKHLMAKATSKKYWNSP